MMQLVLLASATAIEAQPAHKVKHAQPATTSHASPETTGTLATASTRPPAGKSASAVLASVPDPNAPDEGALPPLFNLPSATRAQMRACGERWRRAKLDGEAGDEIWRDFATSCLAAKTEPAASMTKTSPEKAMPAPTRSGQPGSMENPKR